MIVLKLMKCVKYSSTCALVTRVYLGREWGVTWSRVTAGGLQIWFCKETKRRWNYLIKLGGSRDMNVIFFFVTKTVQYCWQYWQFKTSMHCYAIKSSSRNDHGKKSFKHVFLSLSLLRSKVEIRRNWCRYLNVLWRFCDARVLLKYVRNERWLQPPPSMVKF